MIKIPGYFSIIAPSMIGKYSDFFAVYSRRQLNDSAVMTRFLANANKYKNAIIDSLSIIHLLKQFEGSICVIKQRCRIYNLSAGKSLPDWLSERERRKLVKKVARKIINLLKSFCMRTMRCYERR